MSKGPLIKTKGKVQLVHCSDGTWHVEYKRRWLPTIYWLDFFEEWTPFRPKYRLETSSEDHLKDALGRAVASLYKTEVNKTVVQEQIV